MNCTLQRILFIALPLMAPAARAQSVTAQLAAGDSDHKSLRIPSALQHYQAAIGIDGTNYEALWKAAHELVDLGEFNASDSARHAQYHQGEEYARRAVAANTKGAEGHFELARAVGRNALTMGARDKIKFGTEVHDEALAALAIDPKHPGALHVMGVWNAEIMRLNWAERTIARTILGGRVFGEASWDAAQRYMEQAVAADPDRITHRLDLGLVYVDRGDKVKAREQFAWVQRAAVGDYNDPDYKRLAIKALKAIGDK